VNAALLEIERDSERKGDSERDKIHGQSAKIPRFERKGLKYPDNAPTCADAAPVS